MKKNGPTLQPRDPKQIISSKENIDCIEILLLGPILGSIFHLRKDRDCTVSKHFSTDSKVEVTTIIGGKSHSRKYPFSPRVVDKMWLLIRGWSKTDGRGGLDRTHNLYLVYRLS